LDVDFNLQGDSGGRSIKSICADTFNLWESAFAPVLSRARVLSKKFNKNKILKQQGALLSRITSRDFLI